MALSKMMQDVVRPIWDRIWTQMAERGECDALGGAEYRRVWQEWVKSDQSECLRCYILRHTRYIPGCDPLVTGCEECPL